MDTISRGGVAGATLANGGAKPVVDPTAMERFLRTFPGPSASPMRQGLAFAEDQYAFLRENRARLGSSFVFRIPGEPPRLVVGAPEDIKKVFALRPDDYYSGDPGVHVNYGESCILFHDGERHRRDRQLLTPPLHGDALRSYGPSMVAAADREIDRWRVGQRVVAHDAFRAMAFDVITRSVLGVAEDDRAERLRRLFTSWFDAIYAPWLFMAASMVGVTRMRRFLEERTERVRTRGSAGLLPFPGRKSVELKAELVAMLVDEVERCRRPEVDDRTDVLAMLSRARYEDGEPMPARAVVDQIVLLVSAGHETSAKSLAWALRDVLERPPVLARIREEMARVFGDGPIEASRIDELVYLDAVIKESMRLTPVTTVLQRELRVPMELGGHTVPAGVVVAPSNYLAHRDPTVFEDPESFRPERFLEPGRKYAPYEYFPFGGGRRRCLGLSFASFEMPILLGSVLRRTELRIAADADPKPVYSGITIGPANGMPFVLDAKRGRP